jgi:hypothetical protein
MTNNEARRERMAIAGDYAQLAIAAATSIIADAMTRERDLTEDELAQIRGYMLDNGYWSTEWRRDASDSEAAGAPIFLRWWGRGTKSGIEPTRYKRFDYNDCDPLE